MVKRAARPCPSPGCFELVRGSNRYCPSCKSKKQKEARARRGPVDRDRYGKRWRDIRAEHLMLQPWCVDCGVLAVEVDHIIPIEQGGTNDHDNLASRCKSCHSRKTAKFDGGFGNPIVPIDRR